MTKIAQAAFLRTIEKPALEKAWRYVRAFQALKKEKIRFLFDDETKVYDETFILSVDGLHCQVFEPRYMPSSGWYSHKSNSATLQFKRMSSVSNHSEFDLFLLDQCIPTKIIIPHKDGRVDFRFKVFPDWEGDIYLLQCQQKLLMDSHYSQVMYFDPAAFMQNDGNTD